MDKEETFAKKYNISSTYDTNVPIHILSLPLRLKNVCLKNNIITLQQLLDSDYNNFIKLNGVGEKSLRELSVFFENLCNKQREINLCELSECNLPIVFKKNIDGIAQGDFSVFECIELTDDENKYLTEYKEAYNVLGKELFCEFFSDISKVNKLLSVFNDVLLYSAIKSRIHRALANIPTARLEKKIKWFVNAYTDNINDKRKILGFYEDEDASIKDVENIERIQICDYKEDYRVLINFLEWCSFNLREDVDLFFTKLLSNDRYKIIITSRSNKQTLEEIGSQINLTRERVRQIEKKCKEKFMSWYFYNNIVLKLYADRDGDYVLTSEEIAEYFKHNESMLLYFLRGINSHDFTYDPELDVFIVGDTSIVDEANSYVDSLPNVIKTESLEEYVRNGAASYKTTGELIERAIKKTFKMSEKIYYRSRLSLKNIYVNVLMKYYSKGIYAHEPEAVSAFRKYIVKDYGPIKLPLNDRAISVRISDIAVLCGKGKYKLIDENIKKADIFTKIKHYVDSSKENVFLMNTIFDVFEHDLIKIGIDNKYFLQGILRELFGEKYTFRRDYLLKTTEITSLSPRIVDIIKDSDNPVDKKYIRSVFPGVTDVIISFATTDPKILKFFGSYFNSDKLILHQDEISSAYDLISKIIIDNKPHHSIEIYNAINQICPEMFTRNFALYQYSAYTILEYLFANSFQFKRPYIAKRGIEIENFEERLCAFIEGKDIVNISDITEFARDNHFQIPSILDFLNAHNDKYLIFNTDYIITIKESGVSEDIINSIEQLILEEITETTPITNLHSTFPRIKVQWTEWLLYSCIKKWGTKLEVATSNAQMRLSTPFVAPKGAMDVKTFAGIIKPNSELDTIIDVDESDDTAIDDVIDGILKEIL